MVISTLGTPPIQRGYHPKDKELNIKKTTPTYLASYLPSSYLNTDNASRALCTCPNLQKQNWEGGTNDADYLIKN
jgi:hypothetical protein